MKRIKPYPGEMIFISFVSFLPMPAIGIKRKTVRRIVPPKKIQRTNRCQTLHQKKNEKLRREEKVVRIGKYKIEGGLGAEHWAICVEKLWYEVAGASLFNNGEENEISKHFDDSKYTFSIEICGRTTRTKEEIDEFNRKWLENHPFYSVFQDNCQLYVREFEAFLLQKNATLVSQNNIIGGNFTKFGSTMIVAGIGLTFLGFALKNHK